jgi:hypothetical protein
MHAGNPMTDDFTIRLDKIMDRVTSEAFLASQGLGNEIPFYAFDYPPDREPEIQDHIKFLIKRIPAIKPDLQVGHVDLFELILEMLKARGFYDKAVEMQQARGDNAVQGALKGPLKADNVARYFVDHVNPESKDLVLISGVGRAYPMIRLHNLLNNLHPLMDKTPLVFFYPGVYDGQSLRLFGILDDKPYYRAFRLVD